MASVSKYDLFGSTTIYVTDRGNETVGISMFRNGMGQHMTLSRFDWDTLVAEVG